MSTPGKSVSREDFQDLRRAMERFDDKLDKSFQGYQDVRVQIEQLNGRLTTHEANVKTGMAELSGKMEQAKSAMELKSEKDNARAAVEVAKTKSTISQIDKKTAILWGILASIALVALQVLAGVIKELVFRFIK